MANAWNASFHPEHWTVAIKNPVVAAFSGTPLVGTTSQAVVFTDATLNTPTSWAWSKSSNGGTTWAAFATTPTAQNPTETFTEGTWAVRLVATSIAGSDTLVKLAYIVIAA